MASVVLFAFVEFSALVFGSVPELVVSFPAVRLAVRVCFLYVPASSMEGHVADGLGL